MNWEVYSFWIFIFLHSLFFPSAASSDIYPKEQRQQKKSRMKDWRPTAVKSSNRVFEALRSEKKEWKKVIIFIQMVRQAAKSTLSCAEGILAFFQQNELWNDSILYMLYAAPARVDVERASVRLSWVKYKKGCKHIDGKEKEDDGSEKGQKRESLKELKDALSWNLSEFRVHFRSCHLKLAFHFVNIIQQVVSWIVRRKCEQRILLRKVEDLCS